MGLVFGNPLSLQMTRTKFWMKSTSQGRENGLSFWEFTHAIVM